MPAESWSFDSQTAAIAGSGQAELPPELQRHGSLSPTPAEMVSDHAAEGAPWLPTARDIPRDPPMGPLWRADHGGPDVPATRPANQEAPPSGAHAGHQHPARYGLADIGRPFTLQITRFMRHLATDRWDPTGKRISPPDAPSAPVQIYGSEHNTRPRLTPFERAPLLSWAWASGQSFSHHAGYWGVRAGQPDLAARPDGAVAAQPPSDPIVAASPAAAAGVDYDLGW